jgi:NAD(P)-dependent dehydrogenase (short-subunit alcohol dehydrogenase family)
MGRLEGKFALITGGSSGMGLATAKLFVQEGARVAVTGRDPKALAAARAELGPRALVFASDTSKPEDIEELVQKLKTEFATLDILFVNAGLGEFRPIELSDGELFDRTFSTNVKGAYFMTRAALPLLRKGGAVIFNTSVAGHVGMANASIYGASKAALRSFALTLAAELADRGIRVNALSPGPIDTPMFGKMGIPREATAATKEAFRSQVPMKRFGTVEEIARAVLFLAHDATYTTGTELDVDGGFGVL